MTSPLQNLDETWSSADLTKLDRAELIAARRALYESEVDMASGHGGDRRSRRFRDHRRPGFVRDTARALNISESAIRQMLRRAEIADQAKELLRQCQSCNRGRDLDKIVGMPPGQQVEVAKLMIEGFTISEAMEMSS